MTHNAENDALDAVSMEGYHNMAGTLIRVEAVLTEWGVLASDGDFVDDDDFAEAIRESGAWRLARDLRSALGVTDSPTPPGRLDA